MVMVTVCLPSAPSLDALAVAFTLASDFSPAYTGRISVSVATAKPARRSWNRIMVCFLVESKVRETHHGVTSRHRQFQRPRRQACSLVAGVHVDADLQRARVAHGARHQCLDDD